MSTATIAAAGKRALSNRVFMSQSMLCSIRCRLSLAEPGMREPYIR